MHDNDLIICTNARPTIVPAGGGAPAVTDIQIHPLPTTLAGSYIEFDQAMDMARGGGLHAVFRIATSFNAVGANWLQFFVAFSDTITPAPLADIIAEDWRIFVQGPRLYSSMLLEGRVCDLAIPPLHTFGLVAGGAPSAIPVRSAKYLGFGIICLVPAADWTAGGITARLTPHAYNPLAVDYTSGR